MKKGIVRRVLILALAGLLCLGMVLYARKAEENGGQRAAVGSIRLWYAAPDCAPAVMEDLLSRCREETGLAVFADCFPDEQTLAAALETDRPDLLFCSHIRAAHIDGIGGLVALDETLPIPESLKEIQPAPGRVFFPIGSRLLLLLQNTALTEEKFDNLESLLNAAADTPFLAADDWSMLLYAAMRAEGKEMQGLPEKDRENKSYRTLYNLLGEASFRGGLAITERDAAEYVRQGMLPCAIVRSGTLAGVSDDGLRVSPMPLPKRAETAYTAELMGFAMPNGANAENTKIFLCWLWNGQGREAALNAGLAPVANPDPKAVPDSELKQLLLTLSESDSLVWPDGRETFFMNHESCEARLRAALDLLA